MQSVLDVEVSCFSSYRGKTPKPVHLLSWLQSEKYAGRVLAIRQETSKEKRDALKASLPAITPSGIFSPSRKEEHLVQHSGLICIDIDAKGNEHIDNFAVLKEQLFNIENVAYAGLSVSGKGFFLLIPLRYPDRHKEQFNALYYDLKMLGITIDKAPRNVVSLRGYSYDADGLFRHQAKPYSKTRKDGRMKRKKAKASPALSPHCGTGAFDNQAKVERIIAQILNTRTDITEGEANWFQLACALANEFGENGRAYFHEISQFHPEYDPAKTDAKFTHALKGGYRHSIATFFWRAERSGLKYKK